VQSFHESAARQPCDGAHISNVVAQCIAVRVASSAKIWGVGVVNNSPSAPLPCCQTLFSLK
jgi:hypothetical protein